MQGEANRRNQALFGTSARYRGYYHSAAEPRVPAMRPPLTLAKR